MFNKTIAELSKGLRNKEYSSEELTKVYLDRIKKVDPKLNSFITITEEQALINAKQADLNLANNQNVTALTGIPMAHKDIFCTKNIKTSSGSKMLDNFHLAL